MSKEKSGDKLSFFGAFVAGGLIGAGITLLLAPLSNRQTRERIESTLTKAQEAIERATEIEHEVKELIDRGKETISEAQTGIQAAVEAGREAFKQQRAESLKEET